MLGGLGPTELAVTTRTVSELSARVTALMNRVRSAEGSGVEAVTVASARQLVTGLTDQLQRLTIDASAAATTMASWNAAAGRLNGVIAAASLRLDALIGTGLVSRNVRIALWAAGGLVVVGGIAWFVWWSGKRWGK